MPSFNHLSRVRERREHRVFAELLQIVSGLEERLLEGDDDEVFVVAEMVCLEQATYMLICHVHFYGSYKKAYPALGLTILRA
jgi:hypothetical protein